MHGSDQRVACAQGVESVRCCTEALWLVWVVPYTRWGRMVGARGGRDGRAPTGHQYGTPMGCPVCGEHVLRSQGCACTTYWVWFVVHRVWCACYMLHGAWGVGIPWYGAYRGPTPMNVRPRRAARERTRHPLPL